MNYELFENFMKNFYLEYNEFISQNVNSRDDTGVVLRLHLLSEQVIENFICAKCNQPNMFWFIEKSKKEKITISYDHKLKMAKTLGLPDAIYKVFARLNKMRNMLAHRVGDVTLNMSIFEGLSDIVKNEIEPKMPFPLDNTGLGTHNELWENNKTDLMFSNASSECKKLIIIFHYTIFYLWWNQNKKNIKPNTEDCLGLGVGAAKC